MGEVVYIAKFKKIKQGKLSNYPDLECPQCGELCKPINVDHEGSVVHQCKGRGHRVLTWRIDLDGNMLKGATGNRYYI